MMRDLLEKEIYWQMPICNKLLPFRDGEYYIQTAKQELPLAYKTINMMH
jgi:hypothetical protein